MIRVALATLMFAAGKPAPADELPAAKPADKKEQVKFPLEKPRNVVAWDTVRAADSYPWHVTAVKAPESWAKNPAAKGRGIRVAILDTGVQVDHPGLDGKVKGLYDAIQKKKGTAADGHGHGTHCAGIVHSIAPDADLFVIKVLTDEGSGATDDIAHGIDYAVTEFKVDVISMSLGGGAADPDQPAAIKRAIAAGVVVVCAAGNSGPGDTEGYPGRYPDSISVAASDKDFKLAPFSSWGPNVFTTNPGVDILSTLPGSKEGLMSGTSMACPCEAGKVASWIASNAVPKDKNRRDAYRKAALEAMPFKERKNSIGHGLYTLDKVTGTAAPTPTPTPTKPVAVTITIDDLSPAKRAELAAGGVTKFRLEIGHDQVAGKPAAGELPKVVTLPVTHPAPVPAQPIYGEWVPTPQPLHFGPVYQTYPQCVGPNCQPAPLWVPGTVIRRVIR